MLTSYRTCPLCEATCGLRIEHGEDEGNARTIRISGDDDDVFSRGFICPKGAALGELHADPDRLREPQVRDGDTWHAVGWDEAFARVEAGLRAVTSAHGRDAVGVYLGNPMAHNLAGALYARPLVKALGTKNVFTASTVDQMPKHVASGLMFGAPGLIAVPDLDRTDHLLMLGANPWVSNGSLCTAPDFPGRLRALRARGGRLVVVDPVRTDTAARADEHVAIRPGADAWLLAAMVHVLFAEDRVRLGRLESFTRGLLEVRALVQPFAPEAVASACGVEPERIRVLARELAVAERGVVYGRLGTCTQRFGTITSWLVDVLNVLTGNLDRAGGAMFPEPVHGRLRPGARPGGHGFAIGRWKSRVRGQPEAMGELAAATLAEEIDTPGTGQVRALVTLGGNPVVSTPNAARLDRALAGIAFMVSVDPYRNETTRHAHVILPPPTPLQRAHYDVALYGFSVRNVANWSPPTFALPDGALHEWEMLARLGAIAAGQGARTPVALIDDFLCRQLVDKEVRDAASPLHGRSVDELLAALAPRRGPERIVDFLLRAGPRGDGFGRDPAGLRLDTLLEHPHGIDFGPLAPRLPTALRTPSAAIELAPPELVADVARLRDALASSSTHALVLVGRRQLRSNNSWMHNLPGLVSGKPRCTLQIHPDDAARAGLQPGDSARVTTQGGAIELLAEPTARMAPGVVSIPHGWGHDLPGMALTVAREHAGANTNLLTDAMDLDPLSGNAVLTGVPVKVERATGDGSRTPASDRE